MIAIMHPKMSPNSEFNVHWVLHHKKTINQFHLLSFSAETSDYLIDFKDKF